MLRQTLWIMTVAGTVTAWGGAAQAHIHLTHPQSRTDSQFSDQKDPPCGVAGVARNPSRVTTFAPGETVRVTWDETIQHTGHFRIAFDDDGTDFGIPPDATTTTFGSDPTVLLDLIPDGTLFADITLPDIECENCTLQFIQLMTDKPPYTTDADSDDIYFNCADIRLVTGGNGEEPAPIGTSGCQSTGTLPVAALGTMAVLLVWRRKMHNV